MTPGARVAAAIEILQDMHDGLAAEQALTRWARRSRFAGSKDRAAIRDHVFDVMRCKRTAAFFGRRENPRALMVGLLHAQGAELDTLFSGIGHAPAPLAPRRPLRGSRYAGQNGRGAQEVKPYCPLMLARHGLSTSLCTHLCKACSNPAEFVKWRFLQASII